MMRYSQRLLIQQSRPMLVLALLLCTSLQTASGQGRTNKLHETQGQEGTNPLYAQDDGLRRIEGTVLTYTGSMITLSLRMQGGGDDLIVRKRPGRMASSTLTLTPNTTRQAITATDYNSSRSNNGSSRSSTEGPSSQPTRATTAQDYNSSRSNNSSGIAQNPADDPSFEVVLLAKGQREGTVEHATPSAQAPAAAPYTYKATVDGSGAFVFAAVVPGAYQLCVQTKDQDGYCGHVTVLK